MDRRELQQRTKHFALRVIRLCGELPNNTRGDVLGKQLLRCGTSVGANYRAACLGKSRADFVNKLKICEEEADESIYWIELIGESGLLRQELLANLLQEARELSFIMSASIRTARAADEAQGEK